jgi:hypothetical protein
LLRADARSYAFIAIKSTAVMLPVSLRPTTLPWTGQRGYGRTQSLAKNSTDFKVLHVSLGVDYLTCLDRDIEESEAGKEPAGRGGRSLDDHCVGCTLSCE